MILLCVLLTGVITYLEDSHALIDGMFFFDMSACSVNIHVMDKVTYLCYKDENESLVVVRILENHGAFWGNEDEAVDESSYDVVDHVFVGEVELRQDRTVFVKNGNSNVKFDLDNVTATFVPIPGDWLELLCKVKFDIEKPMDISFDMVSRIILTQHQ